MLVVSFVLLLLAINVLQAGWRRAAGKGALMRPHAIPTPHRASSSGRRRAAPRLGRWLLIGVALAFLALFLFVPLVAVFVEALERGSPSTWPRSPSPTRCRRSASRCSPRRSRCRSTWSSASPRPGRSPSSSSAARAPDHADRSAVLGLAGDLGPDLRAAVRRAGLVRPLAARRTTSRSSSPCRASCWRPSSSPSRSSRAS